MLAVIVVESHSVKVVFRNKPLETASACVRCGFQLPLPQPNYCSNCGQHLTATSFRAFPIYRTRWLFLVFPLAVVAGALGGQALVYVVLAGWMGLVLVRSKMSIVRLIGKLPAGFNWWLLPLIAIAGMVFSIGSMPVVWYPLARAEPEFVSSVLSQPFIDSRLNLFLLLVIMAPIVEETLFRGFLFSRLTTKWGMTKAMVASSLAFGLLHLNPIGATVFGLVACILYMRTGTLLAPIAVHALNNLMVWTATFGGSDAPARYDSTDFLMQGLVAMLIAGPIIVLLLRKWWPSRGALIPYERFGVQEANHSAICQE